MARLAALALSAALISGVALAGDEPAKEKRRFASVEVPGLAKPLRLPLPRDGEAMLYEGTIKSEKPLDGKRLKITGLPKGGSMWVDLRRGPEAEARSSVALVYVIFALSAIQSQILVELVNNREEAKSVTASRDSKLAMYAADAGIQEVLMRLNGPERSPADPKAPGVFVPAKPGTQVTKGWKFSKKRSGHWRCHPRGPVPDGRRPWAPQFPRKPQGVPGVKGFDGPQLGMLASFARCKWDTPELRALAKQLNGQ